MVEQKQGICPKCGSQLEYKSSETIDEGQICKGVYCSNDKCSFIGLEWYEVIFVGIDEVKS